MYCFKNEKSAHNLAYRIKVAIDNIHSCWSSCLNWSMPPRSSLKAVLFVKNRRNTDVSKGDNFVSNFVGIKDYCMHILWSWQCLYMHGVSSLNTVQTDGAQMSFRLKIMNVFIPFLLSRCAKINVEEQTFIITGRRAFKVQTCSRYLIDISMKGACRVWNAGSKYYPPLLLEGVQ